MKYWEGWKPATCLPDCFCEVQQFDKMIVEPINTWTNLAFVIWGIYLIATLAKRQNANIISQQKYYSVFYGFCLIVLGAGSFFYHMSMTFVGQWMDVMGMYLIVGFFIMYNLVRIGKLNKVSFTLGYLGLQAVLGYILYVAPEFRRQIFGAMLVITLVQSLVIQKRLTSTIEKKYLFFALGTYLTAQGVWLLDRHRIECLDTGWMNGHGIWHILTATAAFLVYKFFVSEKASNQVGL